MSTYITPATKLITGSGELVLLSDVIERIESFLEDGYDYSIDVGTDSQTNSTTKFVTAIVIHKRGKGGIFFYCPYVCDKIHTLRDRIYMETTLSISCATGLLELFLDNDILRDISIHCDVGPNGKTKEMIREIVGYVTASGFDCRIKPEGIAACTVADRFSK